MFRVAKDLVLFVILAIVLCGVCAEAYDTYRFHEAEVLKQIHAEDVSEEFRAHLIEAHHRRRHGDKATPSFIRISSESIGRYTLAEGALIQSVYDTLASCIKEAGDLFAQSLKNDTEALKDAFNKLDQYGVRDVNDVISKSFQDALHKNATFANEVSQYLKNLGLKAKVPESSQQLMWLKIDSSVASALFSTVSIHAVKKSLRARAAAIDLTESLLGREATEATSAEWSAAAETAISTLTEEGTVEVAGLTASGVGAAAAVAFSVAGSFCLATFVSAAVFALLSAISMAYIDFLMSKNSVTGYIVNDSLYDMKLDEEKYVTGTEYIPAAPLIPATSTISYVVDGKSTDLDVLTSIGLFAGQRNDTAKAGGLVAGFEYNFYEPNSDIPAGRKKGLSQRQLYWDCLVGPTRVTTVPLHSMME